MWLLTRVTSTIHYVSQSPGVWQGFLGLRALRPWHVIWLQSWQAFRQFEDFWLPLHSLRAHFAHVRRFRFLTGLGAGCALITSALTRWLMRVWIMVLEEVAGGMLTSIRLWDSSWSPSTTIVADLVGNCAWGFWISGGEADDWCWTDEVSKPFVGWLITRCRVESVGAAIDRDRLRAAFKSGLRVANDIDRVCLILTCTSHAEWWTLSCSTSWSNDQLHEHITDSGKCTL
jgi:hypothetical protein